MLSPENLSPGVGWGLRHSHAQPFCLRAPSSRDSTELVLDGGPVCAGPGVEVARSQGRISVPLGGGPPRPHSAGRGDLVISVLRVEDRW